MKEKGRALRDTVRALTARLSLVALVFGAANFGAWACSPFYEKEREYQRAVEEAVTRQPRVLIVGDSHADSSLRPEQLADHVYNLSWGADGPREISVKLAHVLPRLRAPLHVIVSIDVEMFSARRGNSPNRSFLRPYLWALRDPSAADYSWRSLASDSLPFLNDGFIQFTRRQMRNGLRARSGGRLQDRLSSDEEYWGRELDEEARRDFATKLGRNDHAALLDSPELAGYYRRIRESCRDAGARTIAVRFPVSEAYRAQISPEGAARVDALVLDLGFDRVLDYSGLVSDPALFANPDHLNRDGARVFLRQLERETGLSLARSPGG